MIPWKQVNSTIVLQYYLKRLKYQHFNITISAEKCCRCQVQSSRSLMQEKASHTKGSQKWQMCRNQQAKFTGQKHKYRSNRMRIETTWPWTKERHWLVHTMTRETMRYRNITRGSLHLANSGPAVQVFHRPMPQQFSINDKKKKIPLNFHGLKFYLDNLWNKSRLKYICRLGQCQISEHSSGQPTDRSTSTND